MKKKKTGMNECDRALNVYTLPSGSECLLNAWSVSVSNLFLFLSFLSFCSLVLVCDFSFAVEAKIFLEVTGTMVLLLVIS